MNKAKFTAVFLLCVFGIARGDSVYRNAGTSAWPFLRVDISAKAAALGGTSLLNPGSMALFSNPALLPDQGASISASHSSWFGNTNQEALASVVPWGRFGTSLAFRFISTSGLEYRETPSSEPTGTFDVTDISLGAGAGLRLSPGFSLGAGITYIREKVWLEESSGLSFDFGLASFPLPGLTLAAAAQNIGPGVTMVTREYRLPRSLRAGLGYEAPLPLGRASISYEIHKPLDNRPVHGLGLEYMPLSWAALRGGWRVNDPSSGLTAGMGLSQGGWILDYAYVPGKHALGETHRFTLTRTL
jgi:hypothetical protein